MSVLTRIEEARAAGKKLFAVLIDPEKCTGNALFRTITLAHLAQPDFIFVGGSQWRQSVATTVEQIKAACDIPVVLFPGNNLQLSDTADALLLLSLLSGRNPDFLIGQHVEVACAIKTAGIETIPTAYLLIDGGRQSAVETVSQTRPITDPTVAAATALAGELLGYRLAYLEAGSGALITVSKEMIVAVRKMITLPLIVGGGLKTTDAIAGVLDAGADLIVVGNHLEQHPEDMPLFADFIHQW
jgi:putative glycerol-1-phosphate prenyltransferase